MKRYEMRRVATRFRELRPSGRDCSNLWREMVNAVTASGAVSEKHLREFREIAGWEPSR